MHKNDLLHCTAKICRILGLLWMTGALAFGLISMLWDHRELTHAEQVRLYEREVGHGIAQDMQKRSTTSRDAKQAGRGTPRWVYVGEYEKTMHQAEILKRYFGASPPTKLRFDWIAALRHLLDGALGLIVAWTVAWLLDDFRA
ncbi:hypothetical protein [Cupriavidus numazuensis]|uniref:Uncharacterized protein n=1 Tax=Cupriavidus numazuensis TaxID=221992 RepID=A0ABM8TMW2_9BURK|nr:hypothetical protein [Cupriavidus numazuensis]CAG2155358.1 hypothetical protein LMG26411_04907 [Cupriavidus numazuensis]